MTLLSKRKATNRGKLALIETKWILPNLVF